MNPLIAVLLVLTIPLPAFTQADSTGRTDSTARVKTQYVCPPCGCDRDDNPLDKPGPCPDCGMAMVDRATTLTLTAVPNFRKVNDSVWTAGQPTISQLGLLKAEGVKTIINLRMRSEHDWAGEEAKAREMGITYVNIPVDYDAPKSSDVDSFLRATDDYLKKGKTFIHCTAAIRVGSFWMIRRVVRDGWDYEKAREEARQIGLRRDGTWLDFAKTSIENRRPAVKKP